MREIRFIQSKSTFIRMREIFASFVRKDLSARTTDSLNEVYEYNVHLKRQSREKKNSSHFDIIREIYKSLMTVVVISFQIYSIILSIYVKSV